MQLTTRFHNLCGPAKTYLVFSILLYMLHMVTMDNRMENRIDSNAIMYYTLHLIAVLLWTLFLNWVCSMKQGVTASWILFFSPLILFITVMISGALMIDKLGLTKDDLHKLLQQSEEDCGCDKD
jgi:hypothetical protein